MPLALEVSLVSGGEVAPDERLPPQGGRHAAVQALVRPEETLDALLHGVELGDLPGGYDWLSISIFVSNRNSIQIQGVPSARRPGLG